MSLKDKSTIFYSSGDLLRGNNYYASSIHCYYYSNLQLIKHVLINKFKISDSVQIQEKENQNNNIGDHVYLISTFRKEVYNVRNDYKITPSEITEFNSQINSLRKTRRIADYEPDIIDEPTSRKMKLFSESNNKLISKLL